MKTKNKLKSVPSLVLSLALFYLSSPAVGAEIVTCLYLKTKSEHRCIVKALPQETMRVGDEVVVYQKDIYWVGTGKILKVKGVYSVASFTNAARTLTKGLRAEISSPSSVDEMDWAAAFSKKD